MRRNCSGYTDEINIISIYEPSGIGVIIARLQIVQSCFSIVVIPAIADGIILSQR